MFKCLNVELYQQNSQFTNAICCNFLTVEQEKIPVFDATTFEQLNIEANECRLDIVGSPFPTRLETDSNHG